MPLSVTIQTVFKQHHDCGSCLESLCMFSSSCSFLGCTSNEKTNPIEFEIVLRKAYTDNDNNNNNNKNNNNDDDDIQQEHRVQKHHKNNKNTIKEQTMSVCVAVNQYQKIHHSS